MVTLDEKVILEGEQLLAELKRRQELWVTAKRSPSPFRYVTLEHVIVIVLAISALNHVFGKYTDSIWIGLIVYVVLGSHTNALTLHKRLDALIGLLGDERLLGKIGKETKANV